MRNRAGEVTAQRILEATRRILSRHGLEGTTVKSICDDAEVRAGSFYNLFSSKEEVVLIVLREAILAVDPDPDRTGRDTVADLVEAYVAFVLGDKSLAGVYLTVAVSGGVTDPSIKARLLRHHEERVARFSAALRRERPDISEESARQTVEALLAALNGFAFHWLLDPSFDFAGHARRLLAMEPV